MSTRSRKSKVAVKTRARKPVAKKAATKPAPKVSRKGAANKKNAPKPKPAPVARAKTAVPPPPARPVTAVAERLPEKRRAVRRREFERYRKPLLERQRELMRDYLESKREGRTGHDSGTEDYIDYAVSSYAKEFVMSLTEMDRKQLLQVEEAVRRIDRGEFGRCQQCGEDINPRRLEVAPWARYCVRCQELEEQGLLPQMPASFAVEDVESFGEDEYEPLTSEEEKIDVVETEEVDDATLPLPPEDVEEPEEE